VGALLLAILPLHRAAGATNAPDSTAADSVLTTAQPDSLRDWHEAVALLGEARAALDSILAIEERYYSSTDEERQLLRVAVRDQIDIVDDTPRRMRALLPGIGTSGARMDSLRQELRSFLVDELGVYKRAFDFWEDQLTTLRSQRGVTSVDQLGDLELNIEETRKRLDAILQSYSSTIDMADALHLDTQSARQELDGLLHKRTETLVGRLTIAVKQRDHLSRRVKDDERAGAPETDIGANRIQLRYAEERVRGLAQSLDAMVSLLDKRGIDTTEYRKTMIRATGDVTQDVLDPRVLFGLLGDAALAVGKWSRDNLPTLLLHVVIVIGFMVLGRLLFRLLWWVACISRLVRLPRLSRALFEGLVRPLGSIVGLLGGLWFLGANPGTLLAGVGVVSVIIGLALQESLSNLASGFFILVTRPYDVDDVVMVGSVMGTVKKMGLANTTIRTFDGRRLMVPNRRIWGEVIENRSAEALRRVEITVRVGYDEDLDRVLQLLRRIVQDDERVLKKPEPEIFVLDLDQSWALIAVRPWVRTQDWWPLLTQLPRLVRLRFAEAGIEIPYPRSEISLAQSSPMGRSGAMDGGKARDASEASPPESS